MMTSRDRAFDIFKMLLSNRLPGELTGNDFTELANTSCQMAVDYDEVADKWFDNEGDI